MFVRVEALGLLLYLYSVGSFPVRMREGSIMTLGSDVRRSRNSTVDCHMMVDEEQQLSQHRRNGQKYLWIRKFTSRFLTLLATLYRTDDANGPPHPQTAEEAKKLDTAREMFEMEMGLEEDIDRLFGRGIEGFVEDDAGIITAVVAFG
ncbi:hypothetical protein BDP27DRAFT_1366700 [Rhodocollybia butyracea]|uniref:Uncharacterized protein n=1 Tax=Rhodocollybia butyracea TaxID=206335 RepID=A0A9P5PNF7_9AGAR|nr:hypothetical protein BDP27DRAFT_1366700 [Rhodocollybia butyracea]